METLTPQDFLGFRDKLVPSSGFQSYQMRVMEILMGLDESQRILYGRIDPLEHIERLATRSPGGAAAWSMIQKARGEDSVLVALNEWLYRTPIRGSQPGDDGDETVVQGFLDAYLESWTEVQHANLEGLVAAMGESARTRLKERFDTSYADARAFLNAETVEEADRERVKRVRAALLFIESYRELPLMAWPRLLLDVLVEMEEHMLLWRNRHARMVERLIGRRVGTGGSGGVDYLDKTRKYRVFVDLWAIRTVLLPKDRLPPMENVEGYGFAQT